VCDPSSAGRRLKKALAVYRGFIGAQLAVEETTLSVASLARHKTSAVSATIAVLEADHVETLVAGRIGRSALRRPEAPTLLVSADTATVPAV